MSTVADEHGHVAIFWDYENCAPPSTAPGYDITNNIREIAHRFGSVKQFKAYLEMSEQSSAKAINLRSELQSCGVSLTDCPHNGRKEVADKMMIVDMLTYAIDTPAPATLVLITGDRDFVYAVSVLRLRKYRIVLVAPTAAHASLKSQASEVLDWNSDVLGKPCKDTRRQSFDTACAQPGMDSRRRAQSASVLMNLSSLSVTGNAQFTSTLNGEKGRDQSGRDQSGRDQSDSLNTTADPIVNRTTDAEDEKADRSPRAASQAVGSESSGWEHLEPIQDLDAYIRSMQESSDGDTFAAHSPPPTFVSPAGGQATSRETAAPREDDDVPLDEPVKVPPVRVNTSFSTMHLSSGSTADDHASKPTARVNPMQYAPGSLPASQPQMSFVARPVLGAYSFFPQSNQPAADPRTSIFQEVISAQSNVLQSPLGHSDDIVPPVPPTPSSGASLRGNAAPIMRTRVSSLQPLASPIAMIAVQSAIEAPVRPETPSSDGSFVYAPSSSQPIVPLPPVLPPIPPEFEPLLQALERCRKAGIPRPLRSLVGLGLAQKHPKLYSTSGFANFTAYAAHAEKTGLVTLGGVSGRAWIALEPTWYDRVAYA